MTLLRCGTLQMPARVTIPCPQRTASRCAAQGMTKAGDLVFTKIALEVACGWGDRFSAGHAASSPVARTLKITTVQQAGLALVGR
ncbi:MAG TPA: hypothetical protein VE986_04130 [Hyphomicrobiales bacterium]|nr:hypothetical protein [Hyphomicrobiales bacterium]